MVPRRLRDSIQRRGWLATLKLVPDVVNDAITGVRRGWSAERQRDIQFDSFYGTDTGGRVALRSLTIQSEHISHGRLYTGVRPDLFSRLLDELPVESSSFTFIDYGSGKGRALLLAGLRPFRRVVGIEFAEELCNVARRNVEVLATKNLLKAPIEVVQADAATYTPPPTGLVCFFFNPFEELVMTRVIDAIERSLLIHPRPAYLVYINPVHRSVLDQKSWWSAMGTTKDYAVYEFKTKETCPIASSLFGLDLDSATRVDSQ
jgi:hypothetical protein